SRKSNRKNSGWCGQPCGWRDGHNWTGLRSGRLHSQASDTGMLDSPPHFNCLFSPVSEFEDWLAADQLPAPLDPLLHDWLYVDKGSLTRRLTLLAAGAFSVTPLREGWQPLRNDECAALGVAFGSSGWVREVYLRGHGEPWVFARSVAARSALEDSGFDLQRLGSRSLGELLFSDQAFTRGPLEAMRYPDAW